MIKQEHKNLVSIKRACELCKVSRSGYYDWLRRPAKTNVDVLGQKIKRIFKNSRKTYGTRRIKKQLAIEGIAASRQRISRKMAEQGLIAKAHRKTRATTNSNHDHPVALNLLNRQFDVKQPNKVWVMDITYLATNEGWLYLAIVLDLYSRMVVGWSISKRMTQELVIDALETAIKRRNPSPGLICHSDRGSQYCSHAYQNLLQEHGFICSDSELKPILQAFIRTAADIDDWVKGIAGIIVKKPLDAWNDHDFMPFVANLRDYVDRIDQLEALNTFGSNSKSDAVLLSVMDANGKLTREIFTSSPKNKEIVDRKVKEILSLPESTEIILELVKSLLGGESYGDR
jgi:putative transposase